MTLRLSSETIHASAVADGDRAVLICGPSGAGKSDLALRLIDRGWRLVSDDQTIVHRAAGRLLAAAPTTIAGKLEVRGLGILELDPVADIPVALVVELTSEIQRMPDARERTILDISVPLISVDAMTASAASKVAIALDQAARR